MLGLFLGLARLNAYYFQSVCLPIKAMPHPMDLSEPALANDAEILKVALVPLNQGINYLQSHHFLKIKAYHR